MGCKERNDLLDHLVSAGQERQRHSETKAPRCLKIDCKLDFGRLLHRQIRRLFAPQNTIDVGRRASEQVRGVNSIGDKTAIGHKRASTIHYGQTGEEASRTTNSRTGRLSRTVSPGMTSPLPGPCASVLKMGSISPISRIGAAKGLIRSEGASSSNNR